MRIAFQTICWADRVQMEQWPLLLKSIHDAGYDGVEVFQDTERIPPYVELREMAEPYGLTIVGLTTGSIQSRCDYLRPPKLGGKRVTPPNEEEPFIYIDGDEAGWREAVAQGFRIALHYHHLGRFSNVTEALSMLHANEGLKWLPDTAHLFIGRQDQEQLRKLLFDPKNLSKTIAFHLKDWLPIFGRFSHRFARGFCLPGNGETGLKELVADLLRNPVTRDKWAVVELDYIPGLPEDGMRAAAKRLKAWGAISREVKGDGGLPVPPDVGTLNFSADRLFYLASSAEGSFFEDLAKFLKQETGVDECVVCSVLGLRSEVTIRGHVRCGPLAEGERLHIKAIAKRALLAKKFETDPNSGFKAIPLFNPYNPHMVGHVLLYRGARQISDYSARCISEAIDVYIAQRCQEIAAWAARLAVKFQNPKDLLDQVAEKLREYLHCEGVTVFIERDGSLTEGGSTGLEWFIRSGRREAEAKRYPVGEGRTGRIAERRTYDIYRDTSPAARGDFGPPRSQEANHHPAIDSCLTACFFNHKDEVAGLVRCRNPIREGVVLYFCEDDLALVESAMQAVQSDLEYVAEARRTIGALTVLSHELANPVFAVRGVLYDILESARAFEEEYKRTILKYQYEENVESWLEQIKDRIDEFENVMKGQTYDLEPEREKVAFFSDIIAPMEKQFRINLQQRGFSPTGISYGTPESWLRLPLLWVDRKMFEQIAFNLIGNAIKYAKSGDPSAFKVRIWGDRSGGGGSGDPLRGRRPGN